MQATPDADLLREFSENRSDTAFDTLVRRHLDLVHSAALRLTRDAHQAEDIAQAVFVALARQAGDVAQRVSRGAPLSAWLHLTTRNLAAKMIRSESRRRARERAAASLEGEPCPDVEAAWDGIAPHLDHSLARLSEADRSVVLLRFFERKTAEEIGRRLGIGEAAAQKRISRAIVRLRALLAHHAPGVPVPTLVVVLAAFAVNQAPSGLAAAVSQAGLNATLGVAPAGIQPWLGHFTANFVMTKSQTAVVGLVLALAAVPLGVQRLEIRRAHAESPERAAPVEAIQPAPEGGLPARPDPASVDEATELRRLNLRANELRAQIASRAKTAAASPSLPSPPGVLLLVRGQSVPVTNLVFAGNSTPEGAAQTMLARMRDGDLEGAMSLWLMSPRDRGEWEDTVANQPGIRDEMTSRMGSDLANVLSVELVDVRPLAERRSSVVLRRVLPTETNTLTMTFGLTPSGWKQIP